MTGDEIIAFATSLDGVTAVTASEATGAPEVAWGDTFIFYGDQRQMPFATVVIKDYPGFDEASALDRDGVFRLNVSVGRDGFIALLGYSPGQVPNGLDYTAFDQILPHPAYAASRGCRS